MVEWTGKGPAPRELSVSESVEDVTLAISALDREVQAGWNGRFVERAFGSGASALAEAAAIIKEPL